MKKEEALSKELTELYQETKDGKIFWNLSVQTTEHNPPEQKPKETEDGIVWTVDECYVAYDCSYKGKDFHMITYEMIKTAEDKVTTTNLIFLPDEGMRYFNLHTLLPHSVTASATLISQVHNLWELLLQMYKNNPESVGLSVSEGTLVIED
jgi:hypothetical protein